MDLFSTAGVDHWPTQGQEPPTVWYKVICP